jgi:hypothetical protein
MKRKAFKSYDRDKKLFMALPMIKKEIMYPGGRGGYHKIAAR